MKTSVEDQGAECSHELWQECSLEAKNCVSYGMAFGRYRPEHVTTVEGRRQCGCLPGRGVEIAQFSVLPSAEVAFGFSTSYQGFSILHTESSLTGFLKKTVC